MRAHGALVDAFDGYPLTEWIVLRDERHARRLARYIREMMGLAAPGGHGQADAQGRAAALWHAPDRPPLSAATVLARARALPAIIGWRRLPTRVPGLMRLAADHPEEPHAYLAMLGVRRDHQRRGLGGALLRAGLARCDARDVGAFLHTANPNAIPFYQAHGFEVLGAPIRLAEGPEVRRLWRPAR